MGTATFVEAATLGVTSSVLVLAMAEEEDVTEGLTLTDVGAAGREWEEEEDARGLGDTLLGSPLLGEGYRVTLPPPLLRLAGAAGPGEAFGLRPCPPPPVVGPQLP